MAFLVFNRSTKFDFYNWLADARQDVYALTSKPMNRPGKYRMIRKFDDLGVPLADQLALELGRTAPIGFIASQSEYDMLRVAALREALGLPGQSVQSARAYRDKVLMKDHMAAAGIPTARYRRMTLAPDLPGFIEEHGYPVVVKPVDAAGSRGVRVLREARDLHDFQREQTARQYMVETFVEGTMFHVNGLLRGGRYEFIVPYRYVNSSLDYQADGCYGSLTMRPDTELGERLVTFCQRVIAALPATDPLAFHAEIFCAPDGTLLLNEIASRTAGSLIIELIEQDYGFNLSRAWVRAQCGLDSEIGEVRRPSRYSASLMFPTREAVLRSLPLTLPFEWCTNVYVNGRQGVVNGRAASYTDDVLSVIVSGESEAETTDRVAQASAWLGERIEWQASH
ncbi:ATP-grasp domain-containing protein [Burkholderia plantarii]|uniref:ATP-grasp domain-containing protein n=1 Tax=Burkholderia plantarii TaxID=41899 RepID=UPI0006D88D90|nr:ATP-grasp domain-containing protein [Burkholderia plantarii]ALK33096.1 ATP-dependent carboxylate-amine ligase domain-containing protein ATP-grasp [Burkholderia plantarii]GLZ20530.1 HPr kinase [Burkholderia plantarii]